MKLRLQYSPEKTAVAVRNEIVEVKAYQIIVWVSVSSATVVSFPPSTPRFPAILDTGTTHNFAITRAQFLRWAGFDPENLQKVGTIRIERRRAPLYHARLWLHADDEAFDLSMSDGIAILDGDWPRLPILGLRALTNSKLQTFIYGDTKEVVIRSPSAWFWPF